MTLFWHILFSPLKYICIKDGEAPQKKWFDIICPLLTCVLLSLFLILSDYHYSVNVAYFFSKLGSITNILPGFYIASIAAIATFDKSDLDSDVPGMKMSMFYPGKGIIKDSPLSKRIFLCCMFSYLTFLSVVCSIFSSLAETFRDITINFHCYGYLKYIYLVLLSFVFAQLITITCWALYYISQRIHLR